MIQNKISPKYECYQNDLLLHSMSNYMHQISSILNVLKPTSVCEVGIEGGKFTQYLLNFAKDNQATYIGVEPKINNKIKEQILNQGHIIYENLSLDILEEVNADVFFLDGDHNYYTLYHELKAIFSDKKSPFVFMHDISWPWRHRDLYYNPQTIPDNFLHPYETDKGIKLGEKGTTKYGFRSVGQYSFAKEEGGDKNGLLPAIKDFIASVPDKEFEYYELFAIFGLGIIFQKNSLTAKEKEYLDFVKKSFDFLNPLIINMEANRLELLDHFWELGETVNLLHNQNTQLSQELIQEKQKIQYLSNELTQKKEEILDLSNQINDIVTSNAWKIITKYRYLKSRLKSKL